ncbi:unnamed protein product, partial [Rotaria sordida]
MKNPTKNLNVIKLEAGLPVTLDLRHDC